jgi:hypothetical protein
MTINLNKDMREVISDIKKKIRQINEEEKKNCQQIHIIPMEELILKKTKLSVEPEEEPGNGKAKEVIQYNILLKRQQQLQFRKERMINPVLMEQKGRNLMGVEMDKPIIDSDMEERKARSNNDKYFKITDSDNMFNDLELETFQRPWGKLEAHIKINRLMKYAEKLQKLHTLNEDEFRELRIVLISGVNNRIITRKNDVDYNMTDGDIIDIPKLEWKEETRKFSYTKEPETKKEKEAEGEVQTTVTELPPGLIKIVAQKKSSVK